MTPQQFEALAKLLRSRSPSREAARRVLLEGQARKEVADQLGLTGPAVSKTVGRFRAADALMREAYGEPALLDKSNF